MNLLSIQSHVAFGHVGNSAATFALQRCGHEVWPVHTVLLSNHPGHGRSRGGAVEPSLVEACVEGIDALGELAHCAGALTGYLTTPEIAEAALACVRRVKQANPAALWCCDPVMGDHGRVYAQAGVVDFFRQRAAPEADVMTPNLFELEHLTGCEIADLAGARAAMEALAAQGPRVVVVTSFDRETPSGALDCLALEAGALWRVRVARAQRSFEGAGDLFAALFFAAWLETRAAGPALARAAASVAGVIGETTRRGQRELALIAAQAQLAAPSLTLRAERVDS